MKLAWFGPLPPVRSGIAHYASLLLPALADRHEVVCVTDQAETARVPWTTISPAQLTAARAEFDAVFCQLGNNPYHEGVMRWSLQFPSILVVHDLVLHHLLVEMTLARGDSAAYIAGVRASHGDAGAAWAAGRAAGAHGEIGNFLFPCFRESAVRARHIVVHNEWAASQIRAAGVETPITIAGHPWIAPPPITDGELATLRTRFALPENARIVAMLGFVTAAKRPAEVLRAFAAASRDDDSLHLLIAGEPAPGIDLEQLAAQAGIARERWTATGYVADEDFDRLVAISDAVVNLRYPSAGETSGPLVRVIGAGRDVAVSDYAQFRELPDGAAVKIPFGGDEHEALIAFITGAARCDREAQREWIESVCSLSSAVDAYERAAAGVDDFPAGRDTGGVVRRTLPLFVQWRVAHRVEGSSFVVELTSEGDSVVRSLEWGRPGYRVITDITTRGGSISQWHVPRGDVGKGETTALRVPLPDDWTRVQLRHGLEGIPDVAREPFAVVERTS